MNSMSVTKAKTTSRPKDESIPIGPSTEESQSPPSSLLSPLSDTKKHGPPLHLCPTCDKGFERLYNLKVHLRKHTGETPYRCPVPSCTKRFKWRSSMAHHVRAHHDPSELESSNLESNGIRLSTPSGRPFTGLSLLKKPISRKRHEKLGNRGEAKTCGTKKVKARKRASRQPQKPPNNIILRRSAPETRYMEDPDDSISALQVLAKDITTESSLFLDFEKDENIFLPIFDLQVISKMTSTDIQDEDVRPAHVKQEDSKELEQGMDFLVAVAEDATDAEMENLAKFEAQMFTPDTSPSPPPMAPFEDTSPSN